MKENSWKLIARRNWTGLDWTGLTIVGIESQLHVEERLTLALAALVDLVEEAAHLLTRDLEQTLAQNGAHQVDEIAD